MCVIQRAEARRCVGVGGGAESGAGLAGADGEGGGREGEGGASGDEGNAGAGGANAGAGNGAG